MKNNLQKLRTQAGLSRQELADALGMNYVQQIYPLEKDGANPTLRTAYQVAAVLGVGVADIWPSDVEVEEVVITIPLKIRRIKGVQK